MIRDGPDRSLDDHAPIQVNNMAAPHDVRRQAPGFMRMTS
jgi:hypothetical protein